MDVKIITDLQIADFLSEEEREKVVVLKDEVFDKSFSERLNKSEIIRKRDKDSLTGFLETTCDFGGFYIVLSLSKTFGGKQEKIKETLKVFNSQNLFLIDNNLDYFTLFALIKETLIKAKESCTLHELLRTIKNLVNYSKNYCIKDDVLMYFPQKLKGIEKILSIKKITCFVRGKERKIFQSFSEKLVIKRLKNFQDFNALNKYVFYKEESAFFNSLKESKIKAYALNDSRIKDYVLSVVCFED